MNKELIKEFAEREALKGLKPKTVNMKRREIETFFEYLSGKKKVPTEEDIRTYLEHCRKIVSPNTLNDKIGYIKEFFKFLIQKDEILTNPAVAIDTLKSVPYGTYGVFTESEVKQIIKSVDNTPSGVRDRAILELLYSTGLRLNELASLNIDDVDFRTKEITVRNGKGDKERIVPAGSEALSSVMRYLEKRFRTRSGERDALFLCLAGQRMNGQAIRRRLEFWKKKAGVSKKGGPHALRHSFASHMLARGAPLPMIQRMLGHESILSTQRYVHVFKADARRAHVRSHPRAKRKK